MIYFRTVTCTPILAGENKAPGRWVYVSTSTPCRNADEAVESYVVFARNDGYFQDNKKFFGVSVVNISMQEMVDGYSAPSGKAIMDVLPTPTEIDGNLYWTITLGSLSN